MGPILPRSSAHELIRVLIFRQGLEDGADIKWPRPRFGCRHRRRNSRPALSNTLSKLMPTNSPWAFHHGTAACFAAHGCPQA